MNLTACGESGKGNESIGEPPASFEGMVKDSEQISDYAMYRGVWNGEDGSQLIVEPSEETDEVRYALWEGDDLLASGYIQYDQEYSADYFYNEHDGIAYHSWFGEDGTLFIDSLGTFAYAGPVEGETEYPEEETDINVGAFSALTGGWFLDGDAGAQSSIDIDENGNWTLYERADGDGDPCEVDSGTMETDGEDESHYYAVSTEFDDVIYDLYFADENTIYWGGENDCYIKMP